MTIEFWFCIKFTKYNSLKLSKEHVLDLWLSKSISRKKFWVTEKLLNFHTVLPKPSLTLLYETRTLEPISWGLIPRNFKWFHEISGFLVNVKINVMSMLKMSKFMFSNITCRSSVTNSPKIEFGNFSVSWLYSRFQIICTEISAKKNIWSLLYRHQQNYNSQKLLSYS